MRFASKNIGFDSVEFISLKETGESSIWLQRQKIAGKAVAKCLATVKSMIDDKLPNLSLKDIENECLVILNEYECDPTFKNYNGFPGSVCLSVNKDMVHGIPNNYILQEGDVITLDLGATYKSAIADAAMSTIYGEPKSENHVRLLEKCQGALYAGINAIKIGNQLGCIGNAIYRYVKSSGYHLILNYGGHGIDWDKPHDAPFVANKAKINEGIRIQPGLAIAIEPMLAIGSAKTKTLNDKWTVRTTDISCHFEHSVFVDKKDIIIITDWEKLNI